MIVSLAKGPSGGLDLPLDALKLAWRLEDANLALSVEGDKLRIVGTDGSKPTFTDEERAEIVKWKAHLIAIVNYKGPERTENRNPAQSD